MNALRLWLNQRYVDLLVRRERKHAYKDRVLVVADHWDGSVQVFYHFLLGYLAPLALWQRKTETTRFAVRDCGPMNVWFDALSGQVDIQIIKPGIALHAIVGHHTRYQVVKGLDNPNRHKPRTLRRAIAALRDIIPSTPVEAVPILIVDRQSSDSFHSGPESETEMSGAQRRSVPNLKDVAETHLESQSYRIVDMATISPGEQIAYARASRILVGQHGAGLAHMVWMPRGSTVIEIHPPLPAEAVDVFRLLAAALGHNYVRVSQDQVHGPVDDFELISCIAEVYANRFE